MSQQQPLNLIINEDYSDSPETQMSTLLDLAQLEYIQVKDYNHFKRILPLLNESLLFHVWIHPGFAKHQLTKKTTKGMMAVTAMKKTTIPFYLLTSVDESEEVRVYARENKLQSVSIQNMDSFIQNHSPLSVFELKNKLDISTQISKKPTTTATNSKSHFDVAILNALYEDELDKIKNVFGKSNWKEHITPGRVRGYSTEYKCENGKLLNILAIAQSQTGMVDAASISSHILSIYSPKYLIMTGVCGGKPDKSPTDAGNLEFGDIVLPTKTYNSFTGKETSTGIEPEIQNCETDPDILSIAREHKTAILRKVMDDDFSRNYGRKNIGLYIEAMACSPVVVDKSGKFEDFKHIDRKTIAVEMESYAVMRSCNLINKGNTTGIIIKSVMDKTVDKQDGAKPYAGYISAAFCKELLEYLPF
jgi:nucleoside phosphorylase